jgi:hypothetical protein
MKEHLNDSHHRDSDAVEEVRIMLKIVLQVASSSVLSNCNTMLKATMCKGFLVPPNLGNSSCSKLTLRESLVK